MKRTTALACLAAILCAGLAAAQGRVQARSLDGVWTTLDGPTAAQQAAPPWVRPLRFQTVTLDQAALRKELSAAPMEGTPQAALAPAILSIPMPDGSFMTAELVESPVMDAELSAMYPEIRSYLGQGLEDPTASIRMSVDPSGVRIQVLSASGATYLDPYSRGDATLYAAYNRADLGGVRDFACGSTPDADDLARWAGQPQITARNGTRRREFKIALASTVEHTDFHTVPADTVAQKKTKVTAAFNALLTKINGIYERDMAVRLSLVAGSQNVIFTAEPDGYTSGGGRLVLWGENQAILDQAPPAGVGNANYDIGHLLDKAGGTSFGAFASVCNAANKAHGFTMSNNPTGDAFYVDFVAHEMGHQFDMRHSFNTDNAGCLGARDATHSYEPGSGSTIMSYAGVCTPDNLQANADAYFHTDSLSTVFTFLGTQACSNNVNTGNTVPTIDAGSDYTIPKETPFKLTAIGNDANGDTLSYTWEQMNLGAAREMNAADDGAGPIVRSWPPEPTGVRIIPDLEAIILGFQYDGERLPTRTRTLNFRATARDNKAGSGAVNTDDMVINVRGDKGPFTVTNTANATPYGGSFKVTWNVAGTNTAPINTQRVRISSSTDDGATWTTLVSSTENDGDAIAPTPDTTSNFGVLRVEAEGNIYFNIANPYIKFTNAVRLRGNTPTVVDSGGLGNNNGRLDRGEELPLYIPISNQGTGGATSVIATLESLTPTATIVRPLSLYGNIAASGTEQGGAYLIRLETNHPFGQPVKLRVTATSTQGTSTFDAELPTLGEPRVIGWTGSTPIDDLGNAAITIEVSNFPCPIFRVDAEFPCTFSDQGDTLGLAHTAVGDLTINLISPAGTSVTLLDRPGIAPTYSLADGLCLFVLTDDGIPQNTIPNTQAVYLTGIYRPVQPLAAFIGQDPNGPWDLTITDNAANDEGSLNAFNLFITMDDCGACPYDLNFDGVVDDDDFAIFAPLYERYLCPDTYAIGCKGDFNHDGLVDDGDFVGFAAAYDRFFCP